jgi:hypothetical protein
MQPTGKSSSYYVSKKKKTMASIEPLGLIPQEVGFTLK